jgi:Lrp/AsnC family transcriptional regulator, leucine-responsive regulatory protein
MAEKLDLKDRRILYELDEDSSQSFAQIGKTVGLPKTVVHHRFNSLKKRGILKNTYAIVRFAKLGFTQYKLYFKFHSVDVEKEKEIIRYLANWKGIVWAASCRGKWDVAVTVIARDVVEFEKLLRDFVNEFGEFISDKNVLIVRYSPIYSRNYLLPEKKKQEFLYLEGIEHLEIDETDRKILQILAENSRISILDLAEKLKTTRDVVAYRIKKLEKSGIIMGYRALIDLDKIGFGLYKIILRLDNFSEEAERGLVSFCQSSPNVVQYLRLVGSWDVEVEVEIQGEKELYSLIDEMRKRFGRFVKDFDVLHIVEEYKLNSFPI